MIKNKIDQIILNYLEDTISEKEIFLLKEWLKDEGNQAYFEEFIELKYLVNTKVAIDHKASLERVKATINPPKKRFKSPVLKYAVAASIVLLVSLSILLPKKDRTNNSVSNEFNNHIEIGSPKATLTLGDGSTVVLGKGKTFQNESVTSNGEEIVYKSKGEMATQRANITYNYLSIPRSGLFKVQLPDGTNVWLNSESKLKYPERFISGEDRIVELLYGEAYFEVSPSTEHDGAKFKVISPQQTVEVLGTEFNIKAYKGERSIYTTLVEGKVEIRTEHHETILSPSHQAVISTDRDEIEVRSVGDVYDEISWRDGTFSFKGKTLKEIMSAMSRWYNIDIIFENKDLEDIKFIGVFRKNQNIEHILLTIKNTHFINAYEIRDNQIIVK
ncbi:DUF4974 domain-containing protein [Flavobacteriaceae bacterium F08102]|nr:DUF4974 domain-containing protein [Flavobacteriaceae bacterium F08102]